MKTTDLIEGPKVHGLPLDHIPMRGVDTGIPLTRLAGFVLRNQPDDPFGYWLDGELLVHLDWRLRALQEREGVPPAPEMSSLTLVAVIDKEMR